MSTATAIRELLGEEGGMRRLVGPAATTVLAVALGAGLLGLAGWFIAASAVAGLAVTTTFSFLLPSAGVQALAWARTLGRYGERITTHGATLDLVASLRTSLFARALLLPQDRVAELRSSDLLGRITVDADAVENLLLRSAFPLLAAVAALIGTTGAFSFLSFPLAATVTAGIVLTGVILTGLTHHESGRPAQSIVAARASAHRSLIEALDGLSELRSFGAERRAAAEVSRHLDELADSRRRLTRLNAGGHAVGALLADLTLFTVAATAAGLLAARGLPAPSFVAVCLVTVAAFEPIVGVPAAVTARARAGAASARLTKLLPSDTPPRAATDVVAVPLWSAAIQHRDTVLLTGPSGAGKSTILRALAGQKGAGASTLVAQDAHVFDGTIRDNLELAAPSATERELWEALAAAAFDETVAAFPAGLDTPVGPGGTRLSGGQRRRLSVAQGLIRRTDVLLLDEPTEGLDTETAARLLTGVRAFDPSAALVIALHDRQSLLLPWAPTMHIELPATDWRTAA